MITIKRFSYFFKQGVITFRDASKGKYRVESSAIDELRKEMFSFNNKRSDDKENLMCDSRAVENDVRKALTSYGLATK